MERLTCGLSIETWSIDRLRPYADNPRQHGQEQIAQLARSIEQFGLNRPILVDPSGEIIAGHALWRAAGKLRFREVPVIVLDHLSETQKRAFRVADNQLALAATWQEELLRSELEALQGMHFDLTVLGFSDQELSDLLRQLQRSMGTGDEYLVPEVPAEAVSLTGDVWILGEHRVLCGDATDRLAIGRVLGGEQADLVFTDPPYNVSYQQRTRSIAGRRIHNDDLGCGFEPFLKTVCGNLLEVSAGALYMCMSSSELHTLYRAFTEAGGHWSTFVMWVKNAFTLGRSDYQRQYEPILYGWKEGQQHYWCGARDQGDVWFIDRPVKNDLHPTMKPVELVERAVRNSSEHGQIVLDVFGGSGSTLIAAEKCGRRGRLIELDARYVDVIVERWQQYSGGEAMLAEGNQSFTAVRAARQRRAA